MPRWNRQTKRPELEPYEMDAYLIGLSVGLGRTEPAVTVRREVELDEDGRPVRLVEEVTYYKD